MDSVPLIGWAGIENEELLKKAVEAGFDLLITMDSNMVHQQNLAKYPIAVVALRAASNRLADNSSADAGASRVAPTHQVRNGDVSSLLSASTVETRSLPHTCSLLPAN